MTAKITRYSLWACREWTSRIRAISPSNSPYRCRWRIAIATQSRLNPRPKPGLKEALVSRTLTGTHRIGHEVEVTFRDLGVVLAAIPRNSTAQAEGSGESSPSQCELNPLPGAQEQNSQQHQRNRYVRQPHGRRKRRPDGPGIVHGGPHTERGQRSGGYELGHRLVCEVGQFVPERPCQSALPAICPKRRIQTNTCYTLIIRDLLWISPL